MCYLFEEARNFFREIANLSECDSASLALMDEGIKLGFDLAREGADLAENAEFGKMATAASAQRLRELRDKVERAGDNRAVWQVDVLHNFCSNYNLERTSADDQRLIVGFDLTTLLGYYEDAVRRSDKGLQYKYLIKCLKASEKEAQDMQQMVRFETLLTELELSEDSSPGHIEKQSLVDVARRKHLTGLVIKRLSAEENPAHQRAHLLVAADIVSSVEEFEDKLEWHRRACTHELQHDIFRELVQSAEAKSTTTTTEFGDDFASFITAIWKIAALSWRSKSEYRSETYAYSRPLDIAVKFYEIRETLQKISFRDTEEFKAFNDTHLEETASRRMYTQSFFKAVANVTKRTEPAICGILEQVQQVREVKDGRNFIHEGIEVDARRILVLPDSELDHLPCWKRDVDGFWHINVSWRQAVTKRSNCIMS